MSEVQAQSQENSVPAMPSIEEVAAQFTAQKGQVSAGNEALQAALDERKQPAETSNEVEASEQKSEVAPPVEEKKAERDPTASKFAAIARREREMRQREADFAARQKSIEDRNAELAKKEARFQELKKAPLKTLKELGVDWQDIIADSVGNYKEPVKDPVEQRFMTVEEKLQKIEQLEKTVNERFQQLEQKEVQAAIQEVERNIRDTASDEKYEYIQAVGPEAHQLVKEVMSEYFHTHKKLLDYPEACDIVEKYYETEYVSKFLNTKKVKARASTTSDTPKAPTKPATKKEAKESPTSLSNSHVGATQATLDIDKMSRNDAIMHLAKQLKFRE